MDNLSYKEQYLNPKWQKRRLEILQRDEFKCHMCGSDEKTLHVHHIRYENGRKVWEYDDLELITLCDPCHDLEHWRDTQLQKGFDELRKIGVLNHEIFRILSEAYYQLSDKYDYFLSNIAEYEGTAYISYKERMQRLDQSQSDKM